MEGPFRMPDDAVVTDDLAREQAYLETARRELARMREKTLSARASGRRPGVRRVPGRDPAAARSTARRRPHHGAVLRPPRPRPTRSTAERCYIGRRHVNDEAGRPGGHRLAGRAVRRVLPGHSRRARWASAAPPVRLRPRAADRLRGRAPRRRRAEHDARSQILADEIERPRVGPMRDIVATIQPEQDEIVRADAATTVCVQGAPGTGKTAVGLHRAAYLLYAFRDRLLRSGRARRRPQRAFLDHIGAVLPALGEVDVAADHHRGAGRHDVARLTRSRTTHRGGRRSRATRGWPRCWTGRCGRRCAPPTEALVRAARRADVAGPRRTRSTEVARRSCAAADVRYGAGRGDAPAAAGARVLLADGARRRLARRPGAGRGRPQPRRSKRVRRAAVAGRSTRRLVLSACSSDADAGRGRRRAPDRRSRSCCCGRRRRGPRAPPAGRPRTLVLLDELADLLERTPSLGHVVLDEAQDLSPMQLRAVGRRCSTGSATVLGDLAQGTTPVGDRVVGRRRWRHLGQAGRATSRCSTGGSGCRRR